MASPTPPPSLQPPVVTSMPPGIPPPQTQRVWSSEWTSCLQDEETCWWGTWCCCILSGRNAESFQVGSSGIQVLWTSIWIICTIILILVFPPLGVIVLFAGGIVYGFQRARSRTSIRERYGIYGNFMEDFILHYFCKQCVVCQEAREAKSVNAKEVDYISGQDLEELKAKDEETPPATILELFASLSATSQIIVRLVIVFCLALIVILAVRRPSFLVILLVVFLQPAFIMYIVYWRERRKYVQLDYVIKLFIVGFFLSTTQSIVFEEILQTLIGFLAVILYLIANGVPKQSDPSSDPEDGFLLHATSQSSNRLNAFWTESRQLWSAVDQLRGTHGPRPFVVQASPFSYVETADVVYGQLYGSAYTSSFDSSSYSSGFIVGNSTTGNDDGSDGDVDPATLRRNFWLLFIVLFLSAFVVAAGVEETMKHFAVRCCRFALPIKEPQTALVYLMAAALGFATAENIEYVLGAHNSSVPGNNEFTEELFVLFLRILLPIHVICSVMQATEFSKKITGMKPDMTLPWVLFPAIMLHGSFDFFLFLMSAIQYVFDIDNIGFGVFTFIFPFIISAAGIVYAYYTFQNVERRFQERYQVLGLSGESVHTPLGRGFVSESWSEEGSEPSPPPPSGMHAAASGVPAAHVAYGSAMRHTTPSSSVRSTDSIELAVPSIPRAHRAVPPSVTFQDNITSDADFSV